MMPGRMREKRQAKKRSNVKSRNNQAEIVCISSASGVPAFLSAFFCSSRLLSGLLSDGSMKCGPAEGLDQQNSDQCTAAVNTYISQRRSAGIHKGLMIFIQTCKSHTYESCKEHQPDSTDSVNVERERNGDGQKTILGHVGGLADIKLNAGSFLGKQVRAFACGKYFIFGFYELVADLVA